MFYPYRHGLYWYEDIQLTCCCYRGAWVKIKEERMVRYLNPYGHGVSCYNAIQLTCCCDGYVLVNPYNAEATIVQSKRTQ